MPRETHTFRHVDPGTLPQVDLGQYGAVGGRDRRADRTVVVSYTDAENQMACWEGRSHVCDEIRLALAEVRRRTPSAGRLVSFGALRIARNHRVVGLLHCTITLPSSNGQWDYLWALPHYRGARVVGLLHCTATMLGGSGPGDSLSTPPHYWGAARSGTPLVHRRTTGEQWAMGLFRCTATLVGSSGRWDSFGALPQSLGATGVPLPHCWGC